MLTLLSHPMSSRRFGTPEHTDEIVGDGLGSSLNSQREQYSRSIFSAQQQHAEPPRNTVDPQHGGLHSLLLRNRSLSLGQRENYLQGFGFGSMESSHDIMRMHDREVLMELARQRSLLRLQEDIDVLQRRSLLHSGRSLMTSLPSDTSISSNRMQTLHSAGLSRHNSIPLRNGLGLSHFMQGPTMIGLGRRPEDERASFPSFYKSSRSPTRTPEESGDKAAAAPHPTKNPSKVIPHRAGTHKKLKRKPGTRDRRFNSSTPISLVASARSTTSTETLDLTGRQPMYMYIESDEDNLSEYQCYLRQQIEIFEVNPEDLQYNAQKMNKAVVLGQVGIRCKYCAIQHPWERTRGAVYYSASLGGLYQAAQNMSKNHLETYCTAIPTEVRDTLVRKKEIKRRAGGGKSYWASSARSLGIFEDQYGLRFKADGEDASQDIRENGQDDAKSKSDTSSNIEATATHGSPSTTKDEQP